MFDRIFNLVIKRFGHKKSLNNKYVEYSANDQTFHSTRAEIFKNMLIYCGKQTLTDSSLFDSSMKTNKKMG